EDPPVFRHELFGLPTNLGIAIAQYFGDAPMRGRPLAVENAAFRKKRNARTDTGDVSPARMPFAQPGQERGIFCDPVLHIPTGCRDNDDVGVLDVIYSAVRNKARSYDGAHAAPVNRGSPYSEARLYRFTMQPVPEHACRMKNLNRCNRR